ncbi:MAG: C4-type zinc ribbon domain-containing protein [Actinomycetota bacterium]
MKEFEFLAELQRIDSRTDELREKEVNLPEREKYNALKRDLQVVKNILSEKQKLLMDEERIQKKLEGELELLSLKIEGEEKKLYSGVVKSPKELASIQREVNVLQRRKDEMETELLEQLDVVKALASEVDELSQRVASLEQTTKEAEEAYHKVVDEIKGELEELDSQRKKIVLQIPQNLLALYDEIRGEKHGLAVVSIEEGICQGCYVELPAEEVDKMLRSDELWLCPYCRRILVR